MEKPTIPLQSDLKLSQNAMPTEQRVKVLQELRDYFRYHLKTSIGYQANHALSFCGKEILHSNEFDSPKSVLQDFWNMHINNWGEPFKKINYALETKCLEVEVLEYFAKLWRIGKRDGLDDKTDRAYWGYICSGGATEANTFALFCARDYLTGKRLLYKQHKTSEGRENFPLQHHNNSSIQTTSVTDSHNAFAPVAFYSQEAYKGHVTTLNLLQINSFNELGSGYFSCPLRYPEDYPSSFNEALLDENGWPYTVPCGEDYTIHIPSLVKLVTAFASRGHPPIVIFSSGSTSTGAYDNPQAAIDQLVPMLKRHNMYQRRFFCSKNPEKFDIRNGFWFHIDGALGSGYLPFLEMAIEKGLVRNMFSNGFPVFDFRIPEVSSISLSIYKWFGLPFPASVYMMRREHQIKPICSPGFNEELHYTIAGSRNGHGALLTWDMLAKTSHDEFVAEVVRQQKLILLLLKKLQELEDVCGEDLWVSHCEGSLMVSFKRPKKDIVVKYSLPCFQRFVTVKKNGQISQERRFCSRISVMADVQLQDLELILGDLREPGAFPEQTF